MVTVKEGVLIIKIVKTAGINVSVLVKWSFKKANKINESRS